jgi:hypothetical protein
MILEIRGYEMPPFTLTNEMLSANILCAFGGQMIDSLSILGSAGSTLSNNWNGGEPYSCSCIREFC